MPNSHSIGQRQRGEDIRISDWLEKWTGKKGWFANMGRKSFSDFNFDELKKTRPTEKRDEVFIKYTERMVTLCDDMAERSELVLELADALADIGKLDTAAARYAEFSQYYPGHEKTEYALYRAVVCAHKRVLSYDRDQTRTHETIELANAFLERDLFTLHRAEVQEIRSTCYRRLIESELGVCDYYVKAKRPKAVARRLRSVRTTMIQFAPDMHGPVRDMAVRLAEIAPAGQQQTTARISLAESGIPSSRPRQQEPAPGSQADTAREVRAQRGGSTRVASNAARKF